MLPESLTLPQTKIRNLPCLMSAFKKRVLERNIPYSRALIHNGQAYSVYTPKRGQKASHCLYNLSRSILQYIAYIRRYHFPWSNRTVRNKDMYALSSRERKNSMLGNYTITSSCDNENLLFLDWQVYVRAHERTLSYDQCDQPLKTELPIIYWLVYESNGCSLS